MIVFDQRKPIVIAEIAQAHDGSLGTAHAYIDAVAEAGADAVKFQTHIAAAESTPSEAWRVKFSHQDASRYDYWKRMEFSEEQWHGLKQHADDRSLQFLSSPFSLEAVDLLERVGVAGWKIASGETSNTLLWERLVQSRLPILISTGMSDWNEIDHAVGWVRRHDLPFAVLQCTSMYPTPSEKVGINVLSQFRERYACPVGLSDHSGVIYAGLAAAALGATVIEVHATFHRKSFGPDVPASLTLEELEQLVQGVRFIAHMNSHPVDKDVMSAQLQGMRNLFTKSVVARVSLSAGTTLTREHLAIKKPGSGIPAQNLPKVIGARLRRDVQTDSILTDEDLDYP